MAKVADTNQPDDYVPMTDEQQLLYTQKIRRGYIDEAVRGNVLQTGERGDKALVLQALNDMDRQALTNKRIKADETNGAATAQAANIVASMLERMGSSAMREPVPVVGVVSPSLPDSIPAPVLVPGETEVGAAPLTYKTFMSAQSAKHARTTEK